MKIKNQIIILLLFLFSNSLKAQFHAGFSSGSVSIIGLEAGYTLQETWNLGLKYHPSFDATSSAGYTGLYLRKSFKQSEITAFGNMTYGMRPYLTTTIGLISPPKGGYGTVDYSGVGYTNVNYDKTFGGAIGGGVELLFGSTGKLATYLEVGLGKMPSALKSIGAIDPYSTSGTTSSKFTSSTYFGVGLRFYF